MNEHPNADYIYDFIISGRVRHYRFAGVSASGRIFLYNIETDNVINVSEWQFKKWFKDNRQGLTYSPEGNLLKKKENGAEEQAKNAKKAENFNAAMDRFLQEEKKKKEKEADEYCKAIIHELRTLSPSATERVKTAIGKNPRTLADELEKGLSGKLTEPSDMLRLMKEYERARACYKSNYTGVRII